MKDFSILIACEESQTECVAWRTAGFDAYSCDIQKCSGNHPEWHICNDVTPYLQGEKHFITQLGERKHVKEWRLIIAHPPCTYLTAASNVHMYNAPGKINPERYKQGLQAASFFRKCLSAKAEFVCVENPRPFRMWHFPKPSFVAQPYQFGEPWSKRTYYWLKNLPPLIPTCYCVNVKSFTNSRRGGKARSKSFQGIAQAMVKQWADIIINPPR